jgi:hypothetical protein
MQVSLQTPRFRCATASPSWTTPAAAITTIGPLTRPLPDRSQPGARGRESAAVGARGDGVPRRAPIETCRGTYILQVRYPVERWVDSTVIDGVPYRVVLAPPQWACPSENRDLIPPWSCSRTSPARTGDQGWWTSPPFAEQGGPALTGGFTILPRRGIGRTAVHLYLKKPGSQRGMVVTASTCGAT